MTDPKFATMAAGSQPKGGGDIMGSTTTLRSDTARTGTNPDFPINTNPWRKYISIDLGQATIGGQNYDRIVRAGVLVVENWLFNTGPHNGETHTLVLVATTTNELFCFGEGALLQNASAATPLWSTPLSVTPIVDNNEVSNIWPLLGVCGTPVVDVPNRCMFVVAMWDDGTGTGHYSIFNIGLDTGAITASQELVGAGTAGQTFDGSQVDQRTAINLVAGWLWVGFAAFQQSDKGTYYGWVVAINPDDLTQQLYQPMISLTSSNTWDLFAGGVWGPGGVAAAADGTVYALTGNATGDLTSYWNGISAAGPGANDDYFNALVRLRVTGSGSSSQISVVDWFQDAAITQIENDNDWDFGGSSPVLLPPISGRQLVAFVPKDGNIFLLDSQNLGEYTNPLTLVKFADALNSSGNDTKVALAFLQTPDGRNVLIVGADSNGSLGGFAAFQIDATVTPPTLTQLWKAPLDLLDSFGSPTVIANPVLDPSNPPNPIGLAWIIDGDDVGSEGRSLSNCVMQAYDVLTGTIAYDLTATNDINEDVPHFAHITSGGNSVFCPTTKGFMGFTQFPVVAKSLTFIVDRSTFGWSEVDALEPTSTSVASFGSAYWIVVQGVLPGDLGLNAGNLGSPPNEFIPTVTADVDPSLPGNVQTAIRNMLSAGQFTGPVIPENPALPDEPQGFLFPYTISSTGDQGFQKMADAVPSIPFTLVTLQATAPTATGAPLTASAQIELVKEADPFFIDVNPIDPTQPTWLSFDVRLFKVTEGLPDSTNNPLFGEPFPSDASMAPGFIKNVIAKLNANNGVVGTDSFDGLTQDEDGSAIEFNPTDNQNNLVFNFALARVRLLGKTAGPTPYPVRVFFRLFSAQNTVSDFNTATTYRFATDGTPHGHKIPLLGVQNDANGNPEYVTIPCFASTRINLNEPANMDDQNDDPNAYPITIVTPGVEVDFDFGCWIDINQPQQQFLPSSPPASNWDGPWTTEWATESLDHNLQSIRQAITFAPHQCLVAEIRYDDAPIVPNATTSTSDKLAQRNIAWIDGPNPGAVASRRMTYPVQFRPTPIGAPHPDELMILWGRTPAASQAQLYLPGLSAAEIAGLANRLYPAQQTRIVDEHTVGFDAKGATFVPLPAGAALAAGLLTVTLPPGSRYGDQYTITVRQMGASTSTASSGDAIPGGEAGKRQTRARRRFRTRCPRREPAGRAHMAARVRRIPVRHQYQAQGADPPQ